MKISKVYVVVVSDLLVEQIEKRRGCESSQRTHSAERRGARVVT